DVGAVVVVDIGHDHRVAAGHVVLDHVSSELDGAGSLIASSAEEEAYAESRDNEETHAQIIPHARTCLTTTPCASVRRISRPRRRRALCRAGRAVNHAVLDAVPASHPRPGESLF